MRRIVAAEMQEIDKALLVLSLKGCAMTVQEIAIALEEAGGARVNQTRLRNKLQSNSRTIKADGGFRVKAAAEGHLQEMLTPFSGPIRPKVSEAFLDESVFAGAPPYVREVVAQINVTYSTSCFDACSVMIRRLTETLLIETFEQQGAIDEILDANGEVVTLKFLIERAKSSKSFMLSRQTKNALPQLKNIGDWSAHNRRHLAKRSDLDRLHENLRLAASDLVHLAS